jgi:hypothetical protein
MRVHDAPGPLDHGKGGRDAVAFCGPETPSPVSGMPGDVSEPPTALQSRQSGIPQPTRSAELASIHETRRLLLLFVSGLILWFLGAWTLPILLDRRIWPLAVVAGFAGLWGCASTLVAGRRLLRVMRR